MNDFQINLICFSAFGLSILLFYGISKFCSYEKRLAYDLLTPEQKERHELNEEERIWDLQNPNVNRGRRMTKSEAAKLVRPTQKPKISK